MRLIVVALVAMLALISSGSAQLNETAVVLPAQTAVDTTTSIASFLSDNWVPAPYASQSAQVTTQSAKKTGLLLKSTVGVNATANNTTANATASNATTNASAAASTQDTASQFLSDTYTPSSVKPETQTAQAADKSGNLATSELSIYQFLDDSWTPTSPVVAYSTDNTGYSKHAMG
jgi:hypothetical protein